MPRSKKTWESCRVLGGPFSHTALLDTQSVAFIGIFFAWQFVFCAVDTGCLYYYVAMAHHHDLL